MSHHDYDPEVALALDHPHNGPLMLRANGSVAFPVAHLLYSFEIKGRSFKGPRCRIWRRLSLPARVARSLWLLAAKVLPQRAASSLVRVNMLVKRLMADWQLACNLLRA